MAGLLARIWSSVVQRAAEGEVRSGPWNLPITGGYLPADVGSWWNWWQRGYNPSGRASSQAMVEACVSAYAQTMAMCPGDHWRRREDGGRERVTTSSLSRLLRHPNDYQSISDFLLNVTRSLYLTGNAYALGLRNDRYEIDQLHFMDPNQSSPFIVANDSNDLYDGGQVFYRLGGNNVIDRRRERLDSLRLNLDDRLGSTGQLIVPQRDVLHIRLNCYERTKWPFPLVGESPLTAAFGSLDMWEKIKNQQLQFFENQARPSAVLQTDLVLDKDQVQALRDRWNDQAKGLHSGGVPILTSGLKVHQWNVPGAAKDMQIAELLKLTQDQIALVFRVPLAILGLERGTGATIELMNFWLSSGLGFCMNHIEEAFGLLFNLKGQPDEYVEFDTQALLRTAQKDRIEMLVRGVQGGIFAPNEARAREDLPAVEYGDEPRVQQQVVPLSAAASIEQPTGPAPAAPPAPPAAGPASSQPPASAPESIDVTKHVARSIFRAAAEHDRRSAA